MRVNPHTCDVRPDFIADQARRAEPGENIFPSSEPTDIEETDGGFFLRDAEKVIYISDKKVLLRKGVVYWLSIREPVGQSIDSIDTGFFSTMGICCMNYEIEFGVLWVCVTPMVDVLLKSNVTHLGFVELADA